jgi:glucoamylase
LLKLEAFGQSIWMDFIRRGMISSGELEQLIKENELGGVTSRHEIWSFRHPLGRMAPGKLLRLLVAADATVAWSADNWASTHRVDTTHNSALNVWSADLLTEGCPEGAVIEFTFFCKEAQRSEGRNYSVKVSGPK